MNFDPSRPQPVPARVRTLQFLILIAVSLLSHIMLTWSFSLRPVSSPVDVGLVAPRDLQAPRDIEYVSEVRTEEARQAAERAVAPVYAAPDPSLARQQIERLRTTLQFITLVRDDPNASLEQKKSDLRALSDISLSDERIEQILSLSPGRWDAVQQETLSVLEQVMRTAIRQDNLEAVQRSVASRVSLSFSEDEAGLIAELVTSFVVPNSLYSQELTDAASQAARDLVAPVVQRYKAGETIVPGGEIITPADMEALRQLGMIQPGQRLETTLGAASVVAISMTFIALYFSRRRRLSITNDGRHLSVIALVFLVFLFGARLVIPERTLLPYFYPLPAAALLLTALFGIEIGLAVTIVLSVLAAYGLPNVLELMPYYLFTSLLGLLLLGPARRFSAFLRAGFGIAVAGAVIIVAYRLPFVRTDWVGFLQLLSAVIFNGVASASVALLLQYFLAQWLGLTTALQLLDTSRPDSPLLQFFLRNAPGTYQHSLQVANLAEQAAERIGADTLLTRVGALFHDIGKASNPVFFIENQLPEKIDKHEDLPPEKAAAIIIRHVKDGVALARKHSLPPRLHDFILEHHGTLVTRYQYSMALEAAGGDVSKVDIEKFRYPGPRPRSRETGIVMLADGVEARSRAEHPANEEELRALIRSVIDTALKNGQLDDTSLTLRDLNITGESFATALQGAYHPRIEYPKSETDAAAEQDVPVPK